MKSITIIGCYNSHCKLVFERKISLVKQCVNIRTMKICSKLVLLLYVVLVMILLEPLEHYHTVIGNKDVYFFLCCR
jgi:hypothetical protein